MKKFLKEFKEFISRGNVMDMAVGIIIGGAFTAIINAVVGNILTPLINAIPGADGTSALQIVLRDPVLAEDNSGKKFAEKQKKTIEKQLKKGKITAEEAESAKAEIVNAEQAPATPKETSEEVLKEIRDLLKSINQSKSE